MTHTRSTTTFTLLLLLGMAFISLSGCGLFDEDVPSCTNELRSSVSVLLEDQNGDTINTDDATLEYSVDGGEFEACEHGICGYGLSGDFVIRATYNDITKTEMVSVGRDECHNESKSITITFDDA